MSNDSLRTFRFPTVDLYIDTPKVSGELYGSVTPSDITRPTLGTQIWWATLPNAEARCLKEFYIADPTHFGRQIPDPAWQQGSTGELPGVQRGLFPQRAEVFDKLIDGSLKQELQRAGPAHHAPFRSQFNAYSFEVEALITQFACHYGCDRLVRAYNWGPLVLPKRHQERYVIEMERLEELSLPPVRDELSALHRLLEMMFAVTQLHTMLIPLRCFPPELTRDLSLAQKQPQTRPFHYDLSPDQFMQRPGAQEVILIDFNATRMAETEYSNFSWRTIPGKDYYQPPERRAHHHDTEITYRSNPVYDLYALLVIGLFYLSREDESQRKIQELPRWRDVITFYQELRAADFPTRLRQQLPTHKGIATEPLIALFTATLQAKAPEREANIMGLEQLNWQGPGDWQLVPKAMDNLARRSMKRQFKVGWQRPQIRLEQGQPPQALQKYLDWDACHWQPGSWEEGRVPHPHFSPERVFFYQSENGFPFVRHNHLTPNAPGQATVYACFGGCVDFANPLRVEILPQAATHFDLKQPPAPQVTALLGQEGQVWAPPDQTNETPAPYPDGARTLFEGQGTQPQLPHPEPSTDPELSPQQPLDADLSGSTNPGSDAHNMASETINFDRNLHSMAPGAGHFDRDVHPPASGTVNFDRNAHPQGDPNIQTSWTAEDHLTPSPAPVLSPPPGSAAQGGTGHFDREAHYTPHAAGFEPPVLSPPPADPSVHSLDDLPSAAQHNAGYETGAFHRSANLHPSQDAYSPQAHDLYGQTPQDPYGQTPQDDHLQLPHLMRQAKTSTSLAQLDFLEQQAEQFGASEQGLLLLVNVRTQRCFLQLEANTLQPTSPELRRLAELLEPLGHADLTVGLLLNNLAICSYQSAYLHDHVPRWERTLGFDPCQSLTRWLHRTDPESSQESKHVGGRLWEIRERARETIDYCRKIQRSFRP